MAPTAYTSYVLDPHYKAVFYYTGITMVIMRFQYFSDSSLFTEYKNYKTFVNCPGVSLKKSN